MRFIFNRGKRPTEQLRMSIDFATDVASVTGDSGASISVKIFDDAATEQPTYLQDPLLVGSVGYGTIKPEVAGTYYMQMSLTTTMGFIYTHDIAVEVTADA